MRGAYEYRAFAPRTRRPQPTAAVSPGWRWPQQLFATLRMHRDVTFGVHGALYGAGRRVGHALRYAMENEHREVRLAERNIRGSARS